MKPTDEQLSGPRPGPIAGRRDDRFRRSATLLSSGSWNEVRGSEFMEVPFEKGVPARGGTSLATGDAEPRPGPINARRDDCRSYQARTKRFESIRTERN